MPLPPELDRKIRDRFDVLIENASTIIAKMEASRADYSYRNDPPVCITEYNTLAVQSVNLIRMLFGNTVDGEKHQRHLEELQYSINSAKAIIGRLTALKTDYVDGFLVSLEDRLTASVAADYMEQAESLLNEGSSGQYAHVPAAVLCGAVLENRLRRWCDGQTPALPTTKPDGSNKTLGPLIAELQKSKAFDKLVIRQLQGWADIRNHAAHGEFDKFARHDVEMMLPGVENFLVTRLASD